jgi:hypothetical protein
VGALSTPLKLLREWLVIEEGPWVFVFAVEPLLDLFHDTQGVIHLPVIREHEERRIFAFRFGRRLHDRMRHGAGLRGKVLLIVTGWSRGDCSPDVATGQRVNRTNCVRVMSLFRSSHSIRTHSYDPYEENRT